MQWKMYIYSNNLQCLSSFSLVIHSTLLVSFCHFYIMHQTEIIGLKVLSSTVIDCSHCFYLFPFVVSTFGIIFLKFDHTPVFLQLLGSPFVFVLGIHAALGFLFLTGLVESVGFP